MLYYQLSFVAMPLSLKFLNQRFKKKTCRDIITINCAVLSTFVYTYALEFKIVKSKVKKKKKRDTITITW